MAKIDYNKPLPGNSRAWCSDKIRLPEDDPEGPPTGPECTWHTEGPQSHEGARVHNSFSGHMVHLFIDDGAQLAKQFANENGLDVEQLTPRAKPPAGSIL